MNTLRLEDRASAATLSLRTAENIAQQESTQTTQQVHVVEGRHGRYGVIVAHEFDVRVYGWTIVATYVEGEKHEQQPRIQLSSL